MSGSIDLESRVVSRVALLGRDYRGVNFELVCQPGDMVQAGAAVMRDARRPAMQFARFLFASNPKVMSQVLGIVYRGISAALLKKAVLTRKSGMTGAVTPMQQLLGHSITYRVAVGAHQGKKVFTLKTVPAVEEDEGNSQAAKESGFSLHAGVLAQPWERKKLERLCRYIARPSISEKRLSITPAGNVRYQLKTPYRDGTTHVVFEPMDFLSKLAALVPKPRVNLTRFHGVFAANSCFRSEVTPARRGRSRRDNSEKTPEERRRAMNWAQRLKRVFNIDVEVCKHCGGQVKVLACIEDQQVIDRILSHLDRKGEWLTPMSLLPENRGPPQAGEYS